MYFSKDWLPDGFMSQSTTYTYYDSILQFDIFVLSRFLVVLNLEKFLAIKFYSRKSNPHQTKSSTMSSIEVRPSSGTAVTENPGKVLTSKMNSKVTKIFIFFLYFFYNSHIQNILSCNVIKGIKLWLLCKNDTTQGLDC